MESSDALHSFRHSLYECPYRRGDALFKLTDAILCADAAAPSPVNLSLQPAHRRGWGSFYAALGRERIDAEVLRNLLARHPLAGSGATPVYAVDMSAWPRCDAEYSPLLKDTITILLATRPAYRGRMGLPVHCTAQLRPRELDRPRGRRARPALPGRQRGRRRAGEGLAGPARKRTARSSVRLQRLLYDPVKLRQGLAGRP